MQSGFKENLIRLRVQFYYEIRQGDILIKKDRIYEMAHIIINDKVVSVDEEIGTAPLPISDLKTFDLAFRF